MNQDYDIDMSDDDVSSAEEQNGTTIKPDATSSIEEAPPEVF
jgi:hypothetical protein